MNAVVKLEIIAQNLCVELPVLLKLLIWFIQIFVKVVSRKLKFIQISFKVLNKCTDLKTCKNKRITLQFDHQKLLNCDRAVEIFRFFERGE